MSSSVCYRHYTANVYRGLWGVCRFSLQYLWKRAVRITEKPYTPQREKGKSYSYCQLLPLGYENKSYIEADLEHSNYLHSVGDIAKNVKANTVH